MRRNGPKYRYQPLPYPAERSEIWFSSNRNSRGGDFDIVSGILDFSYHEDHNILDMSVMNNVNFTHAQVLFSGVNSPYDELEPHSFLTVADLLLTFIRHNSKSGTNAKKCRPKCENQSGGRRKNS